MNEEAEELHVIGDLTPYSECILTFELTDLAGGKSDPDATLTITLSDDDVPVCDPKTVKISITETQGEHQVGNILVEKHACRVLIPVYASVNVCPKVLKKIIDQVIFLHILLKIILSFTRNIISL